jgi:pyrroline-5-carboxylate reductase
MTTTLPQIALVGTGNMSGAILQGLLQPGVKVAGLRATTRGAASAEALVQRGVSAVSLEQDPDANRQAVADAEIIVLGVKPYQILEVLTDLVEHARPEATVVSVAAGITLASMENIWPGALVRAMPNTPAQVGRGVTGLARGSRTSDTQAAMVEALFSTVGEVLVVKEDQINALSSISGSGPAYVYLFIEHFMEVARQKGFTEHQARVMVEGTFSGALAVLAQSDKNPEQLRVEVTSPGGSTAAALQAFEDADLEAIFAAASDAAIARAEEMSRE